MQFSHSNANPQSKQLIKVEFIQIVSQRITLISSSVLLDQVVCFLLLLQQECDRGNPTYLPLLPILCDTAPQRGTLTDEVGS